MIFWLFTLFQDVFGIRIPTAFFYTSTRMMLAAVTSLLFCIFLGPWFIKKLYQLKIGQSIRTEECPTLGLLHSKKRDTPTMGGILIIMGMLLSLFLWMDMHQAFTWIFLGTTLLLGLLGGWDDYLKLKYRNPKGLSAKKKLIGQLFLTAVLAGYLFFPNLQQSIDASFGIAPPQVKEFSATGETSLLSVADYAGRIYLPFFKEPILKLGYATFFLGGAFFFFVIAGTSNAVNLTDGLDGLAAGCLIMVASCLALIAFLSNNVDIASYLNILYINGSGEIAVYLSAFIGATLGFLWYNAPPAQLFMGDIGSLTLGGIIGVAAVLLKREFLLALIGGVFVAETLSVILQVTSYRLRNKKRIFLCTPLHHHFEFKGYPETKVVIRFWIVGLLLAIFGIASLKFQ